MDSTVSGLLAEGYPVRRVNVDQERNLANRYGVQGIPCFVMVVNGREVDRTVGVTDSGRLEAMFTRNGVSPEVNAAPRNRREALPQRRVPFRSRRPIGVNYLAGREHIRVAFKLIPSSWMKIQQLRLGMTIRNMMNCFVPACG